MKSFERYFKFYLVIVFLLFMFFFIKEYFFIEKAKNHVSGSIVRGCLSLEKKFTSKYGGEEYIVNIDGGNYLIRRIVVDDFPFIKKYYTFLQNIDKSNSCYKIEYVKVEFLFFKRVYIYDLVS